MKTEGKLREFFTQSCTLSRFRLFLRNSVTYTFDTPGIKIFRFIILESTKTNNHEKSNSLLRASLWINVDFSSSSNKTFEMNESGNTFELGLIILPLSLAAHISSRTALGN